MNRFILLVVGCLLLPTLACADIYIDDFNEGWLAASFFDNGDYSSWKESGLSGVIGGTRDSYFSYTEKYLVDQGQVVLTDSLIMYTDSIGSSIYTKLLYDANGLGLNLDLSKGSDIEVRWKGDHVGFGKPTTMAFTLTDSLTNSYKKSLIWDTYAVLPSDYLSSSFALNEFASGGVQLANVKSILFEYDSDCAFDGRIDYLKVNVPQPPVPEPVSSALFLLGGGVFGLGLLRKKERRNQ